MGYSTSKQTLEDFRHQLTYLEQGKEQVWLTEVGKAGYIAYKIRECLYIARLYPTEYPQLAAAAENFTVEVVAPNKVQARAAGNPTQAVIMTQGAGEHPKESVTHGLEDPRRRAGLATAGPQTSFSIIEVWKKAQPSNDPIYFPDAALDEEQLTLLYNWTQNRTPKLMILVDDAALTLGPVDEDIAQFAWSPAA